MRIFGVVAEFNPFHSGHLHLLTELRRAEPESFVVAVMSGNFVQRGEAALTEKRVRTRAALLGGVDLVLELPLTYAAAPARRFAEGAVGLLHACDCDGLAFGSECGDTEKLRELAGLLETPELTARMRPHLESGMTFAKAREEAAAELLGAETASLLSHPNNTLAIEYLRAAEALSWRANVFTIKRQGAAHDGILPLDGFASASYLRRHAQDEMALRPFCPPEIHNVYSAAAQDGLWPLDQEKLSGMMLSYLRRLPHEDLARLPDLSEGIEDRLYKAIRAAGSLGELHTLTKTKRYPLARIRRLALSAFLGVTAEDTASPPPYLRILGMTARGQMILARAKVSGRLPVSTSLAWLRRQNTACARAAALEARSTDLYTAALPVPLPCGYDYTASAILFRE